MVVLLQKVDSSFMSLVPHVTFPAEFPMRERPVMTGEAEHESWMSDFPVLSFFLSATRISQPHREPFNPARYLVLAWIGCSNRNGRGVIFISTPHFNVEVYFTTGKTAGDTRQYFPTQLPPRFSVYSRRYGSI